MVMGGGLGPYGDIVVGGLTGQSRLSGDIAGPAAGIAERVARIGASAVKGDVGKAGDQTAKLAKTMVPGNIISEWILNRMLGDGIDSTSDNGYLK